MSDNKCFAHIICAGEKSRAFAPEKGDLVIAADGGLNYAREWNIEPNIVIGDFDSLGYRPSGKEVIALPVEKDDTDTLDAVKIAVGRGYNNFFLHCAAGGECDHTIANIAVLTMLAKNGKRAYMYEGERILTVICDETLIFSPECKGKLSVFACGDETNVKIDGLKYEYTGKITNDFPLGCGNLFIGKSGRIYSEKSAMIVFPSEVFANKLFKRSGGQNEL